MGNTFGWLGTNKLALGFPDGAPGAGPFVGFSESGRARIRYNNVTKTFQGSIDGGVYTDFTMGGGGASPWVEMGTVVRLQTVTNDVVIGGAAVLGAEKLRVIGESLLETVSLPELGADPGATANQGKVYTKDVAAVTELFYQDSAGNVVQITSGGAVAGAGGLNTQVQFNSGGVLAGDADFTFDGTNVTLANALFANGGVDTSGPIALSVGGTNASGVSLGKAAAAVSSVGTFNAFASIGLTGATSTPFIASVDGVAAGLSSPATGRLRYNDTNKAWEGSSDGGAYVSFKSGGVANSVQLNDGADGFSGTNAFTDDGSTVTIGTAVSTRVVTNVVPDNTNPAFRIEDDAGNTYFQVKTTNFAESISIGNSITDPNIFVSSNNPEMYLGQNGNGRLNVTDIGPDSFDVGHVLNIGEQATTTAINVGQTGAELIIDSAATALTEQAADPGATANKGKIYTKDVAAVTELFYQDSAGNVVQLTSGGTVVASAGGLNTQVQFNSGGALAGDADFTFDGASVTLANILFADGGVGLSAAGTLQLGADANTTAVQVASAANPATLAITIPDSDASAVTMANASGIAYLGIDSSTQTVTWGQSSGATAGHIFYVRNGRANAYQIREGANLYLTIDTTATERMTFGLSGAAVVPEYWFQVDPTNTAAFRILEGSTQIFNINTTGNNNISWGNGGAGGGMAFDWWLEDNAPDAFLLQGNPGGEDYFLIVTTNGSERIVLGNGTTDPAIQIAGLGVLQFTDTSGNHEMSIAKSGATGVGRQLSILPGDGGDASGATPAGAGGVLRLRAGTGGDGNGTAAGGSGASVNLDAGAAGADGGAGTGVNGDINIGATNAVNVNVSRAAGKFGLFGVTAVVQQATTGTTAGFTAGVGTGVNDDSTFDGNLGGSAYTIGDIVRALINYGALAA